MIKEADCWLKGNCKQIHCDDPNGCMILFKLDYLYNEANVPINLRKKIDLKLDADGTDLKEFQQLKSIQDNIEDFVKNGDNLLIHSRTPGNGKTSWALRLLQTYFNRIWLKATLNCHALFINVPYFLIALKDNINEKNDYIQHINSNISSCDLVIWDDIGHKMGTDYEISNLLSMIESRIIYNKSNIYTSNLTDQQLQTALDGRLASRICNNSINIILNGGDKRGLH